MPSVEGAVVESAVVESAVVESAVVGGKEKVKEKERSISARTGFMRVVKIREDKTSEYKAGAKMYGNSYLGLFEILGPALDPPTPERIKSIDKEAEKVGKPVNIAEYRKMLMATKVGKSIIYGVHLATVLSPDEVARLKLKREKARIPNVGTLIELGAGAGTDLGRAYAAGARRVFAVDPDVHALLALEARCQGLYLHESTDPNMGRLRVKQGIPDPIIHPKSPHVIDSRPQWTVRTIVGEISKDDEEMKDLVFSIVRDPDFPNAGVACISCQFAAQYFWENEHSIANFRAFCDRMLAPEGLLAITYLDGKDISDIVESESIRAPWKSLLDPGKRAASDPVRDGVVLLHSDGPEINTVKYSIRKLWTTNAPMVGRQVELYFPVASARPGKEWLVYPKTVLATFAEGYEVVFNNYLTSLEQYSDLLKRFLQMKEEVQLHDIMREEDMAYIELIRVTILRRTLVPKGKKQ